MPILIEILGQSEKYVDYIFASLHAFGQVSVFLGVFFFGEFAILLSILQSEQSFKELFLVVLASVLALLASDSVWFAIGRYLPRQYIPRFLNLRLLNPIHTFFETYTKNRILISLCFFKFFFGSRLAFVLYLSRQEITFYKFLSYNFFGTVVYVTILTTFGLLLSEAVSDVFVLYKNIVSLFTLALMLFIFSYLLRKFYTKSI